MTVELGPDPLFLQRFGKFLGVLVVNFTPIDESGVESGLAQLHKYSGFFIELDGTTYFVTAGHNFERNDSRWGLSEAVKAKHIRVTKASLADFFSPDAKSYRVDSEEMHLPTIIDAEEPCAATHFMNDETLGLDFAFMPLKDFYVRSIKQAGVVPITEDQWQDRGEATKYALVGFPDEEKLPTPEDSSADATVRPCLARMERCQLPSHLPKPNLPYFAAKLPDEGPESPVGFSGSPIFGEFLNTETRIAKYTLVAIDYKWHSAERIIVGCLMTEVVSEFRKRFCPGA